MLWGLEAGYIEIHRVIATTFTLEPYKSILSTADPPISLKCSYDRLPSCLSKPFNVLQNYIQYFQHNLMV